MAIQEQGKFNGSNTRDTISYQFNYDQLQEDLLNAADTFGFKISPLFKEDPHYWLLIQTNYFRNFAELSELSGNANVVKEKSLKLAIEESEILAALERRAVIAERKAAIDYLTGAWSRESLDNQLLQLLAKPRIHEDLAKSRRTGIAFIDIDHFKNVNDAPAANEAERIQHHQRGDAILQGIVTTVKSIIRTEDFIGRYGGEEFILIMTDLPEESTDVLFRRAEQIRQKIPQELGVTVSIGITLARLGDTKDSLYARADNNMYIVKNNGRDGIADDNGMIQLP